MSIQAISYVLQNSPTKLWDRLVLISLANHANDQALSWPAVQTIAHEAGIGQRTVQRSLRRLESFGEITPTRGYSYGGRRSTEYFLAAFDSWRQQVGGATGNESRKTLGNPTVSQRFSHDRVPKQANTPPARHPTPAKADVAPPPRETPLPRQYGGGATPRQTPGWAKRDTPAPSAGHPSHAKGGTLTVLEPVIEPSTAKIAPPTPPQAGGNGHPDPAEPILYQVGGGAVVVWAGNHRRLLTDREAAALAGGRPDDYVNFFRRRGFRAEVITNET